MCEGLAEVDERMQEERAKFEEERTRFEMEKRKLEEDAKQAHDDLDLAQGAGHQVACAPQANPQKAFDVGVPSKSRPY